MIHLNEENPIGELRSFVGTKHLLIKGSGTVRILKSLDRGVTFYPVTDNTGEIIELSGSEVLFNSTIENDNGIVMYQLELVSGDVAYEVL